MQRFEELGFYTLAGAPDATRALIDEVRDAETLGLGHAFISERLNVKEAATVSGAVGAVSESIATTARPLVRIVRLCRSRLPGA